MLIVKSLEDPLLISLLSEGQVGIIPTDTIYGLAARASDPAAVDKLSRLKRGERYRPGTVVAASAKQLVDLGVDADTIRQVEHLWPNALSIELPLSEKLSYLYQDGAHRAFRVVADKRLAALLEQTGPLLTSSVNPHGEPPANTIEEAKRYFGDEVDFYVEGGDLSGHPPSTVATYRNGQLTVVRQGAVKIDQTGHIAES